MLKTRKILSSNSTLHGTPPSQTDSSTIRKSNGQDDIVGEMDCGTPIKLHFRSNKKRKRSKRNTSPIKSSVENDKKLLSKQSVSISRALSADTKKNKVIRLSEWCIQWPPLFKKDPETKRVLECSISVMIDGFMLGRKLSLLVVRRVTTNNVIVISRSSETDRIDAFSVELGGCLDIEKGKDRNIPVKVMELMVEGFPSQWKKRLCKLLKKAKSLKQDQKTQNDSFFLQKYAQSMCKKAKMTGKKELDPLMEWWRGDKPEESSVMDRLDDTSILSTSQRQGKVASSRNVRCTGKDLEKVELKGEKLLRSSKGLNDWTEIQLEALETAKFSIPPNDLNFWEQVAELLPGKSASECRSKSFEQTSSPFRRKSARSGTQASTSNDNESKFPGAHKMHRVGSNLWKKQVRGFVKKYEAQNADDIFTETPMKHAVQALELDTQQFKTPEILASTLGLPQDEMNANGPETLDQKLNFDDSDSDAQPLNHGREVLGDLDTLRRDEVDSYVLAIKRRLRHRHGLKRDSCVSKLRKENCLRAKSKTTVSTTQNCGNRVMEGTISPGGTASIQFKDDDSFSEELDKEDDSQSDYED